MASACPPSIPSLLRISRTCEPPPFHDDSGERHGRRHAEVRRTAANHPIAPRPPRAGQEAPLPFPELGTTLTLVPGQPEHRPHGGARRPMAVAQP